MATFDFVEAAAKGYKFLWDERRTIVRLGLPPALVKFVCLISITSFDLSQNFLRQGLVLLPSYFAEGWLLAHLIRLALYDERPFLLQSPKDGKRDETLRRERPRAILSCIAVYVLIKLIVSFLSGLVLTGEAQEIREGIIKEAPEPTLQTFLIGMTGLALTIWLFRLIWLYIPAAMGYPIAAFMRKIRGYITSVYMLGTWLICFLPVLLVLMVCSEILVYVAPGTLEDPSAVFRFFMTGAQVFIELVIAIVSSVGMAYGIRSILYGQEEEKDNF